MNEDIRGRVTKKMLKESLHALMKHKPLSKITVREICEKTRVSRPTFYAHYHDVYALVTDYEWEKLMELGLEDYVGDAAETFSMHSIGEKVMLALIKHVDENGDIYKNFFEGGNNRYLEIALRDILERVMENPVADRFWRTPVEAGCFVSYHCAGILNALQNWMKMGADKKCSAEEYARIVGRFMVSDYNMAESQV